jgi:ATP-binding protein involved in chromosome partitioning
MTRKLGQSLLGVVENMSAYACPCCGEETAPFGRGGGRTLATQLGVPLLAEIPLEPVLREGADAGEPVVAGHPESASAQAIAALAERLDQARAQRPAMPSSPLAVIRG